MTRAWRRSCSLAKPYARNGGGRAWLPNVPVQGRTRRGHVLARSGVVIDVLDRGRADDNRPPRPVGGIGAHGNVVQIVLKPSHGIQRLGDGPLLRGPILGRRFLRDDGALLLRDVSFFGDRRR